MIVKRLLSTIYNLESSWYNSYAGTSS